MVHKIRRIDISKYGIQDQFFIDANVLYYLVGRDNGNSVKVAEGYSNFIGQLFKQNCRLCVSTLTMQEVLHLEEKRACARHFKIPTITGQYLKKFRANKDERIKVKNMLDNILTMVSEDYKIIDNHVTHDLLKSFVDDYNLHKYDPIDYLLVQCNISKCCNFITNDKDFQKDINLNIFTY